MAIDQAATFEVEDISVLEILNNPLRLKLLGQLMEPITIRDVSQRLGVPVTRLYYHMNLLEDAGVVRVVETRKSGARIQRVYQAVATRFQPSPRLVENAPDKQRLAEVAASAVLDGARLDAVAGLLGHFDRVDDGSETWEDHPGTLGRTIVHLTPELAGNFSRRLEELVDEINAASEDQNGEEWSLSFVFFPMVTPLRGDNL